MSTTKTQAAEELQAAIQKAAEEYAEAFKTKPAHEVQPYSDKIKELQGQLGALIAEGANPCKKCGNAVMGMIKTPSYMNRGVRMPTVFEIGCVICSPILVEREGGEEMATFDQTGEPVTAKVMRLSYSARAVSVEEATENWNGGVFVEDTRFDWMAPETRFLTSGA